MNSKKREHTDSQLEKDLKNEDQMTCLLLVSMNFNLILLKVHNTLSTREEKRRLRLQLVQENMKLLMRKDTDLQLVKNSKREDLKIFLHPDNMKSSPESLKVHNTL